jgi:deoxyribodipyrimidine photo-lyase
MQLVWFKRDLRLSDHAPLVAACASGEPVLPLYIIEPALWSLPENSARHYDFLLETLNDLDEALRKRGAYLVVKTGETVQVLADLHAQYRITALHAHEETGLIWTYARDRAVRAWAKKSGIPFIEARQHGVWRGHGNRNGWAARWERMMSAEMRHAPDSIRMAAVQGDEKPDKIALGLQEMPCSQRQTGGRSAAIDLLKSFLSVRGRHYRWAMSTPNEGAGTCSRLSAHLALGSISIREAYQAATRARLRWRSADDQIFAQSISSFISRLHWHCHFIQKFEDEPEIQNLSLHPAYRNLRPLEPNHDRFVEAWASGNTGFPFVDACMRSLNSTGWLNFRMRAMVMAFSSYHLWQPWQLPAQRLAQLFTDFEPGIHYPQVQMQSGVTGVNTARIYNPVKQGYDQDPDAVFIRRWLPELAALPTPLVHEPWRAPETLLRSHNIHYPPRLVDHEVAARAARTAIYGQRKGAAYQHAANAIQDKHGSRKSGLALVRKRKHRDGLQAEFDFS